MCENATFRSTNKRSPFNSIKIVETFKSGSLPEKSEKEQLPKHSVESGERPWPLIGAEEHHYIEESGGEYQGFVDQANGERRFEDILVNHSAYYDEKSRTVVQMFVSTEAVNDEGGTEMKGPGSVQGFSTLIVCRSRSGETLGQPQMIRVGCENFPDTPRDVQELRFVARALHGFVLQNVGRSGPEGLKAQAEAYLAQVGWAKKP